MLEEQSAYTLTLNFDGLITLPNQPQIIISSFPNHPKIVPFSVSFSETTCTGEALIQNILYAKNQSLELSLEYSGKEKTFEYTRHVVSKEVRQEETGEKEWKKVSERMRVGSQYKGSVIERRWVDTSYWVEPRMIEGNYVSDRNGRRVWKKGYREPGYLKKDGYYEKGYFKHVMKDVVEDVEKFELVQAVRDEKYGITLYRGDKENRVGETYFFNDIIDLIKLKEAFENSSIFFDMRYK